MPESLRERALQAIKDERLLQSGDRVLVGVSGGPDSVALLHLLVSLKETLRVQVSVVHVDHQLRPDSADDAAFVERLSRRFSLPAVVETRAVAAEASGRGLSLEDAARRVRYEAFLAVARRQRADRLALAHTADDQAETVLMRLLRGAGLTGLTAIPMVRQLEEITVVRPLLGSWRREITSYLKAHRVPSREDSTNHDPRFLRNRIRHDLLPLLEHEYNPNIKSLLNQLAQQCRTDSTFLQTAAARHWKRLVKREAEGLSVRLDPFLKQPKALQQQLVRLTIQRLQGDLARFEFRHWREIERLMTERPIGTILDLPGEIQMERGRDRVRVRQVIGPRAVAASSQP